MNSKRIQGAIQKRSRKINLRRSKNFERRSNILARFESNLKKRQKFEENSEEALRMYRINAHLTKVWEVRRSLCSKPASGRSPH